MASSINNGSYSNINKIITISYIVIQCTVTIFVSILGAYYVYQQRKYEKQVMKEHSTVEIEPVNKTNSENDNTLATQDPIHPNNSDNECSKFGKLWLRTMWKMRSVYSSLAVHSFDVLTDILVIIEWLNAPNISGDHINPQTMAYCGMTIILFSKILSSISIFIKEQSILRSILQLLDLLIFQEIYDGHNKIKSQLEKGNKSNTAIEATLSFKYIRQMEAVFESVPQSILQLVYVTRTGITDGIIIISILQSIVSMTNSNLNHDYTRMLDPKYKKYKQKLPPTLHFFKHSICRLSEIVHRIGLLSLIWTVCGGHVFSIVLGIEFVIKFVSTEFLFETGEIIENMDSVLLAFTSLVIVPCEDMYSIPILGFTQFNAKCQSWFLIMWMLATFGGCFVLITIAIASITSICYALAPICFIPLMRMHLSLLEFVLVIFYGILGENGQRKEFLFSSQHGLAIFIVTCVGYVIWTQYLVLFPNITLPLNVNVRSKWGYAYGNELSELKKLKWNSRRVQNTFMRKSTVFDEEYKKTNPREIQDEAANNAQRVQFFQSWKNRTDFDDLLRIFYFDETYKGATPAVFALANKNHEIVQWLEDMGAVFHKGISVTDANKIIEESDRSQGTAESVHTLIAGNVEQSDDQKEQTF